MFIDASAIVAVLTREPGYEEILKHMDTTADRMAVSPLVRFETIVALVRIASVGQAKRSGDARPAVDEAAEIYDTFIDRIGASEIEITPALGRAAIDASAKYGKIVGHKAALNFGDCFAYACAKTLNTNLLYKGDDFVHTDLG